MIVCLFGRFSWCVFDCFCVVCVLVLLNFVDVVDVVDVVVRLFVCVFACVIVHLFVRFCVIVCCCCCF